MLPSPPLRRFIWIVIAALPIGALYGNFQYGSPRVGALVGGSVGAALFALDVGALVGRVVRGESPNLGAAQLRTNSVACDGRLGYL